MPKVPKVITVTRKVHFYRANVPSKKKGALEKWEPTDALKHINGLPFTDAGRYHQDGERRLCAWIDRSTPQQKLRLAVIRREGLPFVEQAGAQTALTIPAAAGLVEQTHIVCFPNNIVGAEFNFYGPRLPSLGRYIAAKGGAKAQTVTFEPLVNRKVADMLEEYGAVRMFSLRIRRSEIDALSKVDKSLADAFRAQEKLSSAEELEVVLRPKPYQRHQTLGRPLFQRAVKLAKRKDVADLASRFVVDAVPASGDGRGEEINILDDHLIAEVEIAKQRGRGRGLASPSAYRAITSAYDQLKDDLVEAATIQAKSS